MKGLEDVPQVWFGETVEVGYYCVEFMNEILPFVFGEQAANYTNSSGPLGKTAILASEASCNRYDPAAKATVRWRARYRKRIEYIVAEM